MRLTQSQIERINRLWLTMSLDSKEWDESKHPRAANGQFGKGAGVSPAKEDSNAEIPSLKGNELGSYKDMKELRQKARLYALNFTGKSFSNRETGNEISVAMSGVKHTIAGASEDLVKTIPAIPDLIRTAKLLETKPDKHGDVNSLGVEIYQARLSVGGKEREIIMTVKHWKDGRRYYDHGYMKR